jgi:hypothetical protein
VIALVGFLVRELADDPILDLSVFTDRNFATGATLIAVVGFGMFSGMLLVAVFTQKLLGYDAWTSGWCCARRARQHLLAVRLGHRDARGPALDAGLRLPAQRRQPLHDDPLTLGMDYGRWRSRASSRASPSASSSCRSHAHAGDDPAGQAGQRTRGLRHAAERGRAAWGSRW